ncbi:hypothetical protein [Flavobacterium sp.]|uniref:hypothetical protein n=1 Tax=Flavobacterium sp. TaxID=239 RepID=UPI00374DDC33
MIKIKYLICGFVFSFMLIGCKKHELDSQLEKSILEYQKKVPIPILKEKNNYSEKFRFIYIVNFSLKDKDTIIHIVRRPSGIHKGTKYYGLYEIDKFTPVVIDDENNLGKNFIKSKIRNSSLKRFELAENQLHFTDYPPVFSYLIKNGEMSLKSIDTVSNNWIQ